MAVTECTPSDRQGRRRIAGSIYLRVPTPESHRGGFIALPKTSPLLPSLTLKQQVLFLQAAFAFSVHPRQTRLDQGGIEVAIVLGQM